ncbi:MAG: tape measure protein [Enterococcus casseliflavus]
MDNVMDAMIQMRATGTVNMAQMDRMVRRGVDPWEIYADATGRSVGEVRDAMRDGEMGANEFFDAVEHAMREGGNELASVTGMAQQAGDTWKGSFANMATATARGTASIIQSTDEAFGETRFGSMKENVQGFGKTFEGVLNGVAGVIPPVVSAIDTMVGGIIDLKESSVVLAPAIIGVTTAIAGYTGHQESRIVHSWFYCVNQNLNRC